MHIQKYKIRGITYYRLVKSGRVNGKPTIVWQKHLGTADKIFDRLEKLPEHIRSKLFGPAASMLSAADDLQIKDIIEKTIPDKSYKLMLWQHIVMQAICRFHGPMSKSKSVEWYDDSILPLMWKERFSSSQTILNQFDKVINENTSNVDKIEEEICKILISKGIKPSILIWDPTNFFTYIECGEKLPAKGPSKEKRYDKNIINLGMVVSEENIPLKHTVYEGNKRETEVVSGIVDALHERFKILGENADGLVFVYDRGNNSKINVENIDKKFQFIGSLKKNQLKHLYDIPIDKFEDLYVTKKGNTVKGYKTKEMVYGKEYNIVMTFNEKTYQKQKKKTEDSIEKIKEKLKEIELKINSRKKGKKPTTKGVAKQIADFLYKQYQSLVSWDFDEKKLNFSWTMNDANFQLRQKAYGRTVLFTDLDWTSEKIAKTYNSKAILEGDFRDMKDKLIIPVKPIYFRKDKHIRMHIFICVLSIIFYRYMLWKLKSLKMTDKKITEEIRNMRLAFVKKDDSNSVKYVLENMTPEQIRIYIALGMERYLPN
jgi:transposase